MAPDKELSWLLLHSKEDPHCTGWAIAPSSMDGPDAISKLVWEWSQGRDQLRKFFGCLSVTINPGASEPKLTHELPSLWTTPASC